MANTQFSSSNANTVKLWAERSLMDFESDLNLVGKMVSAGVLRREQDLNRGAGDRVRISWLNRLTDQGLIGNAAATGNESELNYYTDDLMVDQLRIPVSIPAKGTIDAQRVKFDLPEDAYRNMSEWMRNRGTLGALNQLAGNTATTINYEGQAYAGNNRLKVTGLNSAVAPTTTSGVTRIIRPNSLTTDQAVAADTTATLKLSNILEAETVAATSRPYIRPLSMDGGVKYHCYVHTSQYNALLEDTSSPYQYRDLQQSMIASGRGKGEIARSFVFSQTEIIETDKVPKGVNSGTSAEVDNCRRAVFCGADAGAIAYGQGYAEGGDAVAGFKINSDYYDIGQMERFALVGIWGISKLQFNSNDNGVIVISTYSRI